MKKNRKGIVIVAILLLVFIFTAGNFTYATENTFDVRPLKTGDKVIFDNSYSNWDSVKLYIFNKNEGYGLFDWNDSLEMTKEGDSNIYSLEITQDIEDAYGINSKNMKHIIFRNGSGNSQSIDLAYVDSKYAYLFDSQEGQKLKGYWYVYDKTELINLYNEARNIDGEYYTQDSYNALQEKINEINTALSETQRVNQAEGGGYTTEYFTYIDELNLAIENLVVNKQILKDKIDEISDNDYSGYTEESRENLNEAISNANTVYNNSNITVQDIKDQMTALQTAVDNLVVDKSELEFIISVANSFIDEYEKYIDKNDLNELKEIVTAGATVLQNDNATVNDVEEAVENINEKLLNLHFNKELIEELISKAEEYDLDKYTDETRTVLKDAISVAKDLLEQDEISLDDFDELEEKINAAIKQLVEKKSEDSENLQSTNPSTGSNIVYIIMLMIVSTGLFTATYIYKKNN